MLKVYPDNNIIISLEKESMSTAEIEKLLAEKDIRFYYSAAHIMEADAISDYNGFTKEELIKKRLQFIDRIAIGNYIWTDANKRVHIEKRYAGDAYNMETDFPSQERVGWAQCNDGGPNGSFHKWKVIWVVFY